MKTAAHSKLITCIIPRGMGPELVEDLHTVWDLITTNVANGRGVSKRDGYFSEEVDILTVVVDEQKADDVFNHLYDRVEVGQFKGRFMYQQALGITSAFTMPEGVEIEEELG